MRKFRNVVLWLLFLGCCGAFVYYFIMTRGVADQRPPEMQIPDTPLEVVVPFEDGTLLQDIRAIDDRDGDVTNLVVLESVSDIYEGNRATATYAAFDHSGNVSKGQRMIVYTNYQSPRFTLESPLIFRENTSFNVFRPLMASDALDGDLTNKIKGTVVSGETAVDREGVYEVEFRVTNSLGDTAHLRAPVEVVSGSLNTRIKLTDYLVYMKKGSHFDPKDYLVEGCEDFVGRVENKVESNRVGVYPVTFHDEKADTYSKTRLLVVVEG